MKHLISYIILCFFGLTFSQNTVDGRITDQNETTLEAVVISLITAKDSSFVKAEISDASGYFQFKAVENNSYRLKVESLGFKDYISDVFTINNSSRAFGRISLIEDTEALDEVTITAEKPMVQVLADKTVFNVQNTVATVGDSGLELLRRAPGVMIDNSENIMVEGKAGVLIFIDGKPSVLRGQDLVNFLKTLQASDIDALEIITQPSSKYDAEGNAGIINIVLKRDKSLGTNGSLSSGITFGDFARTNNAVSFNTRTKSMNVYGTYSNNFGKNTGFLYLNRTQDGTNFNARTTTIFNTNSNNLRIGTDVYTSSKSTFGLLLTGNFSNSFSDSNSRTPITPSGETEPSEVLVANNRNHNVTDNLYGNVNYRFKDTLGHELNVDVDLGKYRSDRQSLQPNQFLNGDETQINEEIIRFFDTPIAIDIFSTQADYEQNFLKGKLSLGAKLGRVQTDNSFDVFDIVNGNNQLNEDRSNDFIYDERIIAGYLNFSKILKKWNLQVGLRMENTDSDGQLFSNQTSIEDRVTRNYTDWFPSGGLTYQMNQKNSITLIYSKRIQRPNYQNLNPFEYRIDELSFSKGNPFLQPQYTDNLKLSHTYNYRLTTSLSYSFIRDFFAQVTEAKDDGTNFLNTRNVANQKVINLSVSYPTKINDWWRIYASVSAFRSIFEATNPDFLPTSQNTLSLFASNTFTLPKNVTMEISGWYSSPSVWGGTYQTESLGSLNVAFQKRFFDDKLTVALNFNDILFTSPWEGTTRFGELFIDGSGGGDSRHVRFNLTYNFGRNEIKKARKRSTSIENEKNRI
ncbi:TonB-dependent receptor [Winogradskyella maritima]|uniref:TonB-dependent receptor domain-containing protein n=1 Tax=Winogradskyella maritima TaxID=1517766 RepID=A0ABV8AKY3_9FLAO|nr:TonB-dependent receptor [Winogradskyella maritima]